MRVNADSLLIRAAATSTSGTLNDLTTDLIMANNNNNKQLVARFNKQFNISKLGRHSSSRETRLITRETKSKPVEMVEMAETFTADIVTRAENSNAFGPDKLSIFLKNLGPRAIEYITALFNLSVTNCQIPAIWKSSLIIPIPKPGKDTSQGSS